METVCRKYQVLFLGKRKNTINLLSAELTQRVNIVDSLFGGPKFFTAEIGSKGVSYSIQICEQQTQNMGVH